MPGDKIFLSPVNHSTANKLMKSQKSLFLFVIITALILGVISYFGFRALTQESTLNEYQTQQLAKSHVAQTQSFILQQLNQKQVRLDAMLAYLSLDKNALNTLISQDSDIDGIFVLQNNKLVFPDVSQPLSLKDQKLAELIMPVSHDPALLMAKQHKSEDKTPDSGWLVLQDNHYPALIYWRKTDNDTVGVKLSYVKFLADVISALDTDFAPDGIKISDNGQLLYQLLPEPIGDNQTSSYSQNLPFPLHGWQIDYYTAPTNGQSLYSLGIILIVTIILAVGFMALMLYREFNRATRLASQQVSFVGQVSHELKTPLTNITLYAEMLNEMEAEENGQNAHYLGVIISESQRLSRLIQNVLTFTKLPQICIRQVDINQLMNQIYTVFIPVFEAKDIQLNLNIDGQLSTKTDVDRVTQIISNLLSNAEKYAATGKRVDLNVEQDNDNIYIHIRDYGNGITAKEIKQIFQPFYRVKSSITEGVTGTGIGLTIARQLAETLSGEINAINNEPGMTFTLRLPKR
ncbi:sensor histidine kinase [Budvicia aquatica]|uniref:histidine kinase n=2 Tax=Budvicia aquatica TaxID=82979 RepID=A0A484ZK25_9GAMM|nr:HAMP domain-containing sensor histidine kinase [Budvicia aquatica]VFS48937.1 Alkaline phosphatase synthesis sensor protein phoR [Budvicia aquatica]